MQWGYAMNPCSGAKVVTGSGNRQYMELNRIWVHDRMPRNKESRVISYALKTIKLLYPGVEWIIVRSTKVAGAVCAIKPQMPLAIRLFAESL